MSPKPEPDARVVDDKVAVAHERADRIEKDAGAPLDKAQDAAIDTEDRQNEREAADVENLKVPGDGL
jgi:hypothetical protein